jgi:hypothetical protein
MFLAPIMKQTACINKPSQASAVIGRSAAAIFIALTISGCDFYKIFDTIGLCKEQETIGAISPNGRYAATVYQRTCGATTGWDTFINIRPWPGRFRGGGRDVIFGIEGLYAINVVWTDNSHLRVESIRCNSDKVFKQEKIWRDISISYESYGN